MSFAVDTSGAVSTIQAAIIEDLADPTGSTPRVRLRTELLGLSFMRSWYGDPDQRAWETCTDPLRMMQALAMAGEEAPIRVVTKGIERFIDSTLVMLKDADPMCAPDARVWLDYLQHVLRTSTSIRCVVEVAVMARSAVDPDPAARMAHSIYLALPTAPHRFSDVPLSDEELVRRLGTLAPRLEASEIRWLEAMTLTVLLQKTPLTDSQRSRVNTLLRSKGPWVVFSRAW